MLLMAAQPAPLPAPSTSAAAVEARALPWGQRVGFQLDEPSTGCANGSGRWGWGQPGEAQGLLCHGP